MVTQGEGAPIPTAPRPGCRAARSQPRHAVARSCGAGPMAPSGARGRSSAILGVRAPSSVPQTSCVRSRTRRHLASVSKLSVRGASPGILRGFTPSTRDPLNMPGDLRAYARLEMGVNRHKDMLASQG
jgi:hypothetical protein